LLAIANSLSASCDIIFTRNPDQREEDVTPVDVSRIRPARLTDDAYSLPAANFLKLSRTDARSGIAGEEFACKDTCLIRETPNSCNEFANK
jgi:hypothetical protein